MPAAARAYPLLRIRRAGPCTIVRTPAKLNLFLEIEGRRSDGFHDISSLMVPITLFDSIGVATGARADSLRVDGEAVTDGPDNLVLRALSAARSIRRIPPLAVTLRKAIPVGSGLGGGSGNAAGMLVLLDRMYSLPRGAESIASLALQLGSDVPFFLYDGPALVRGRGERVTRFSGALFGGDRVRFLLVCPALRSSTARAYAALTLPLTSPDGPISFPQKTFITSHEWAKGLFNRLETPVLGSEPVLRGIAEWLEDRVPGRWRMTGSGSAFYAAPVGDREPEGLARAIAEASSRWGVSVRTCIVEPIVEPFVDPLDPGGRS